MYKPTEKEKNDCYNMVKQLIKKEDDSECEEFANKVFSIAYAIGADYSEKTIRVIAESLLNKKM